MKKLMFLTIVFGLMIAFTAGVSAQIEGKGRVILVYNASELAPNIGDDVFTRISTGDGDHGMPKGEKYHSLELRQGNKAMYIEYYTHNAEFQIELNDLNAKVATMSFPNPWKTNDKITIRTELLWGGGMEVKFSNEQRKGSFSFVVFAKTQATKTEKEQFNGDWTKGESWIRIIALSGGKLIVFFQIFNERNSNAGTADGYATFEGTDATFSPEVDGAKNKCKFTMKFTGFKMILKQFGTDADCGFGMGVSADGTYTKTRWW